MYFPAPPRPSRPACTGGRCPRHGHKLDFSEPATWPESAVNAVADTTQYGTATALAWGRMHQRLEHRGSLEDHDGELPLVEGTLIRLRVDRLPGCRDAEPVWLWSSRAAAAEDEVNRAWQAFCAVSTFIPVPEAAARHRYGAGTSRPQLRRRRRTHPGELEPARAIMSPNASTAAAASKHGAVNLLPSS